MIDILNNLKVDFPGHKFSIAHADGNNILMIDEDTVVLKWALVTEQDFKNQFLVESLEKDLYTGIKNAVRKHIGVING